MWGGFGIAEKCIPYSFKYVVMQCSSLSMVVLVIDIFLMEDNVAVLLNDGVNRDA